MADIETGYKECRIMESRDLDKATDNFGNAWLCNHGAPEHVSADEEFNRHTFQKCLSSHGINFKPHPTRRNNKSGHVERKNGTLQTIIDKIHMEQSNISPVTIISRATFLAN